CSKQHVWTCCKRVRGFEDCVLFLLSIVRAMTVQNKLLSFSEDGQKFAQSGADGILRVWDTGSGALEHEYQPAQHLTATISCIKFAPQKTKKTPKKKKKKDKHPADDSSTSGSLLALGTVTGSILIYSPGQKDLLATLQHSTTNASVLDLVWEDSNSLLSLGKDNRLLKWEIKTGQKKCEIQVPSGSAAFCSIIDGSRVAVGSSSISLLEMTKAASGEASCKATYTGHASTIMQILPVYIENEASAQYFVSAAHDDKFVYAWSSKDTSSKPVGSFLAGEPVMSISVSRSQNKTVTVAATTQSGKLKVYSHHLNGKPSKKALKSIGSLTLHQEIEDKKEVIPICNAFIANDISNSLTIVYGKKNVLKFERINVSDISGEKDLVRNDPSLSNIKLKSSLIKTITPKGLDDSTHLAPGHLSTIKAVDTKRKRGEGGPSSLPMEDRLNALSLDKDSTRDGATVPPRGDNMTQLLMQGLHSKDNNLLHSVLRRSDEELINNTVRRLPIHHVVPLLEHLQEVITGKGYKNSAYITWVRSVLYNHMSHLSTVGNREELMRPFYCVSAARLSTLPEVTQLHARLHLMLSHVNTRHNDAQRAEADPEALLVYRDESSEDEDFLDDTVGASESEDNWDELSDLEEINGHSGDDSDDMDVDDGQRLSTIKRRLEDEHVTDEDEEEDDDDEDDNGMVIADEEDSDDDD
ncbi:unnamed protein product, partial [Meganyctiphanes norvegica]